MEFHGLLLRVLWIYDELQKVIAARWRDDDRFGRVRYFFAAHGFFAAQGFFAAHGFFAAQGFDLAAQGFFAAQGLALAAHGFFAAQGFDLAVQGFFAAQGLAANAEPARPRASAPMRANCRDLFLIIMGIPPVVTVDGRVPGAVPREA